MIFVTLLVLAGFALQLLALGGLLLGMGLA